MTPSNPFPPPTPTHTPWLTLIACAPGCDGGQAARQALQPAPQLLKERRGPGTSRVISLTRPTPTGPRQPGRCLPIPPHMLPHLS
jgi:hypothetical protein